MKFTIPCLLFGAAFILVLVLIAGMTSAQTPTLCSNGMCVLPEKDLMDLLYYLQHLERVNSGKCA